MSAQPPSNAYVTPPPQGGPPAVQGGGKFGAAPVAALATTVLVTVGGAAANVLARNHTVRAMCGNERMGPGDTCTTTRRGIETGTQTYTEVLANALRVNQAIQWVGLAFVVIGVVFAVLTVIRWRQDVDTRARLGTEHGTPVSAHSATAANGLLQLIFGAGFLGGAIYCTLTALGRDQWPWFVGAAICAAISLALLWSAVPGNGHLVEVYDAGLRVVSKGRIAEVPWRDVDHQIVPAKNAATHHILGPGVPSAVAIAPLTDSQRLQQAVAERSVHAKLQPAIEAVNRGETVRFGRLGISREGISHGRKQLSWQDYGGIAVHQGQVTISSSTRTRFATLGLGLVHNYALLVHLIDAIRTQGPRVG